MSSTVVLSFAAIMFVGIVTPGPTVLLALSNGTRFGLKVAFLVLLLFPAVQWMTKRCSGLRRAGLRLLHEADPTWNRS